MPSSSRECTGTYKSTCHERRYEWANAYLFGVLEVLEQGVLVPGDALAHVRLRVREAIRLASLPAEHAINRQERIA